jgi:hypothetical protein
MRTILLLILGLISTPAFAVDLTVDMKSKIVMPDGVTVKKECAELDAARTKCVKVEEETIGSIIQGVLVSPIQGDPDNVKAGSLAIRVYGKDRHAFTHDESAMILRRMDKLSGGPIFSPIEAARLKQALEPDPVDEVKK